MDIFESFELVALDATHLVNVEGGGVGITEIVGL